MHVGRVLDTPGRVRKVSRARALECSRVAPHHETGVRALTIAAGAEAIGLPARRASQSVYTQRLWYPIRIAVFDNDGTLWAEQPTFFQALFALDRIRQLAPQHPEWKTREPFASIPERR